MFNAIVVAYENDRSIREYARPTLNDLNPGIVKPKVQATHFELKLVMF